VVAAHAIDSQGDRGGRGHGILELKTVEKNSKPQKQKPDATYKVAPGLFRLEG
jgi:hypothetical protein